MLTQIVTRLFANVTYIASCFVLCRLRSCMMNVFVLSHVGKIESKIRVAAAVLLRIKQCRRFGVHVDSCVLELTTTQ